MCLRVHVGHAAEERMQKLYQRTMWHLLRVDGQLAPELQAKITVVEVVFATCISIECRSRRLELIPWCSRGLATRCRQQALSEIGGGDGTCVRACQ